MEEYASETRFIKAMRQRHGGILQQRWVFIYHRLAIVPRMSKMALIFAPERMVASPVPAFAVGLLLTRL